MDVGIKIYNMKLYYLCGQNLIRKIKIIEFYIENVQLSDPEISTEYVKNYKKIVIWYPIVSSSDSPIEIGFK